MVPRTYPSSVDPVSGHTQMVAYMLPSVSGLTKWIDYIPIRKGNEQVVGGSYDSYIFVDAKVSQPSGQVWIDYIPVYEDGSATDAWMINAQGYIPYGSASIAAAIQAVRRNNGTMLYVPDNYSGVFTDSAGTTPVTTLGDVVGKLNDSAGSNHATQGTTASKPLVTRVPKRLGPNLVVNGDFSNGTTGWTGYSATVTNVAGELSIDASSFGGGQQYIATVVGRTYLITCSVRIGTTNIIYVKPNGTTIGSTTSTSSTVISGTFVASSLSTPLNFENGGTAGTSIIDNISVQEVLEWSNALDFDGSNDSLTIPVNTGTSGAFIVACNPSATTWRMVAGSGATSPTDRGVRIGFDGSGRYYGTTSNGTAVAESSGGAATANTAVVMTFMWSPSTQWLYVNGVLADTRASFVSASTGGLIRVGGNVAGSDFLDGTVADFAYIPSTLTEADRKTIERNMAQRAGVAYAG